MTYQSKKLLQDAVLAFQRLSKSQYGTLPESEEQRRTSVQDARETAAHSVEERIRRQAELQRAVSEATKRPP